MTAGGAVGGRATGPADTGRYAASAVTSPSSSE
jgi:hypothetical protein